jgi:hypothetical protein
MSFLTAGRVLATIKAIDRADAHKGPLTQGPTARIDPSANDACGHWVPDTFIDSAPCGKRASNGKFLACVDLECKLCDGTGIKDVVKGTQRFIPCGGADGLGNPCPKCSGTGRKRATLHVAGKAPSTECRSLGVSKDYAAFALWSMRGRNPHLVFSPNRWKVAGYKSNIALPRGITCTVCKQGHTCPCPDTMQALGKGRI